MSGFHTQRPAGALTPPNTPVSNRCKHMEIQRISENNVLATFDRVSQEWDIEPNNKRKMRGLPTRRGVVNALYRIRKYYAEHK